MSNLIYKEICEEENGKSINSVKEIQDKLVSSVKTIFPFLCPLSTK